MYYYNGCVIDKVKDSMNGLKQAGGGGKVAKWHAEVPVTLC